MNFYNDVDEHVQDPDEMEKLILDDILPLKLKNVLKEESVDLLNICSRHVKEKFLRQEKQENEDVDSNFGQMLVNKLKKYINELMEKAKETNEFYCHKKHKDNVSRSQISANKNVIVYSDINYLSNFNLVIKNIDKEINLQLPYPF
ncbi:6-phosphofructokinase (PFK11) [Plasmodium ovale curtisi]|uniref:6-phosphofructokinase (PFK11) n=1 Tax=Plasmodium ovale curtisi TaxID=864141 RepID=A0A1A8VTA0_PLAOA|nr:6-phosphofructokinase (PFK11) [Plasmodium ovale curtisi]SBS91332.1 6-phosphofructokinase (PFK11) [Plasmodium ovale curtisi]